MLSILVSPGKDYITLFYKNLLKDFQTQDESENNLYVSPLCQCMQKL